MQRMIQIYKNIVSLNTRAQDKGLCRNPWQIDFQCLQSIPNAIASAFYSRRHSFRTFTYEYMLTVIYQFVFVYFVAFRSFVTRRMGKQTFPSACFLLHWHPGVRFVARTQRRLHAYSLRQALCSVRALRCEV